MKTQADEAARRSGHSRLVYDKAKRTIVTVRDDMSTTQADEAARREELFELIAGNLPQLMDGTCRELTDTILADGYRKDGTALRAASPDTADVREIAFQIVENTPRTTLAMVNAISAALLAHTAALTQERDAGGALEALAAAKLKIDALLDERAALVAERDALREALGNFINAPSGEPICACKFPFGGKCAYCQARAALRQG